MAKLIKRLARGQQPIVVLGLLGLLIVILILMSRATTDSTQFEQIYGWLLLLSALGLGAFILLILYNLIDLVRRYRRRTPGSRLTLHLAAVFAVLAMVPVALVYSFSLSFLQRGIDSWFNVQVDHGLQDALELSRAALDLRMRDVLKQTMRMAESVNQSDSEQIGRRLDEMLDFGEAAELTLFGRDGRIIATATANNLSLTLPEPPPEAVLLQVRQGHDYVGLEPIRDSGFHIRVAVRALLASGEEGLLQSLFPVTDRLSLLGDAVQGAFDSYKELLFLRTPLKASFTLILSLVLLLAVLAAFWAAFYSARRLVQPLRELAEGAQAVAAGQFDQQVTPGGRHELGFLVEAFNQMTRNLARARDSAQRSQQLLENQHAYLETVLARLSSGVLTLDHQDRLQTANAAASQILGVELQTLIGAEREQMLASEPALQDLMAMIGPQLAQNGDWRQEITWFGATGRRILLCRGSALPASSDLRGGHVIVFDDITHLMQAERAAAWAEVARRLAHEIKNPLTPIQLAAERIRHKYLKQMDEEQGRVLERGTHTIVQQVQALKEMVDAFNEYARPPRLKLAAMELNEFVAEVLYLYRDYPANVEIHLGLAGEPLWINGDKGRLRQLLHNLVKNAIEVISDGHGSAVWVETCRNHVSGADCAELSVRDDGPGFPDQLLANAFEPYVTTKAKGTGLGLAVVKKIVEEHGGWVLLEAPNAGGAKIVIRLPFYTDTTVSSAAALAPALPSSVEQEGA